MRTTLGLLMLAATVLAQGHHRKENRALLGIVAVTAPTKGKRTTVVIAHVLEKSPAAKAGLEKGDEIISIADRKITKPEDVDAALAGFLGAEMVEVVYRRRDKKQATTAKAKLIARADYRGDFLKRVARGRTGFKAPEWFVYAWARAGEAAPTQAGTKGKVVVIHCFQSW